MSVVLVLGGTRSGKSARGEALAAASGRPVRYVATASPTDPAMRRRIAAHVARRPVGWTTVEAGASLVEAVADAADCCVLLDGLGPWLATRLHDAGAFADPAALPAARAAAERALETLPAALAAAGDAVVVCEHAGEGVVPADAASRAWLDLLGTVAQRLAASADRAELVVAGRVLELGGPAGAGRPAHGDANVAAGADGTADVRAALGRGPAPDAQELARLRVHGDSEVRPGDVDHAVNVVAGGPPDWLRAVLATALDRDVTAYPREDEAAARTAARHGRTAAEVVLTNGAAEALWLLGPALAPHLAACVHPGFTEAEAGLRAHGIPVQRVLRDPDAGFALDPAAVPDDADLVVVGNPASPSGTLDPASAILALRRPGRTVVVDEAFMDLVPGQPGSLAGDAPDDVIVVRSLTKVLSVPGLRVGYALAAPALAERLRAVRPPWSANALALAALVAAADHEPEIAEIADRSAAQRADLEARLRGVDGLRVWPGAANYVLVATSQAATVHAALREAGVAVRPAASFPGLDERFLRITARAERDNARLAAVVAQALERVAA